MNKLSRRTVLASALSVPFAVAFAGRATAATPPRLILPEPTGPYPIGTVPLLLRDRRRNRELMVSVWYPARDGDRHPRAPWMPAAPMRALLANAGFPPDAVTAPLTAARTGAPVRSALGRLPSIVYSHEAHDHRADTTIVVQELASHGYLVVTVDHTGDAFTEFPDGRLLTPIEGDGSLGVQAFADDIPFVLDSLERLPGGLSGVADTRRIGMFGTSKGGTATALAMRMDPRIRAGLSLDGPMEPLITTDLNRPFMLMTAIFPRTTEPVAELWSHLTGWRLNVQACGAEHNAYDDYQYLVPQVARVVGMSAEDLRGWIGTLDPGRAVRIQQAYPLAFFDQHLRGRHQRLLAGPTRAFPEVRYIP